MSLRDYLADKLPHKNQTTILQDAVEWCHTHRDKSIREFVATIQD